MAPSYSYKLVQDSLRHLVPAVEKRPRRRMFTNWSLLGLTVAGRQGLEWRRSDHPATSILSSLMPCLAAPYVVKTPTVLG